MYGKVKVTLKGESPLLMNRLTLESLQKKSRNVMKNYDPEKEAAQAAYIDEIDGVEQLYIPMEAVFSMMIYTAGAHRMGRRSMKSYLAGGIRIEPEKIPLGTDEYEIDLRPVVIQRARVIRARAKVPNWKASFNIIYDKDLFASAQVFYTILTDAGKRVGLLDYRPQRSGWFGTFTVQEFEESS